MKHLYMVVALLFVVGCGSGSSSSSKQKESNSNDLETKSVLHTVKDSYSNYTNAKTRMVQNVPDINEQNYILRLYADKTIGEDDLSNETYAVGVHVNNSKLLVFGELNGNYPKDTKLVVKVFSKDGKLLAESQAKKIKDELDFGNIVVK